MYLKVRKFFGAKPIMFGLGNAMRTPYSVAIKASDLLNDYEGRKTAPEGSFIIHDGSAVRILPRARVKGTYSSNAFGTATSSATLTLKAPCSSFKVGDVLYAQGGYAEVHLDNALDNGDALRIEINGVTYSKASTVNDTTAVNILTGWVTDNTAALTAAGVFVQQATTDTGAALRLYANDSYSLVVSTDFPESSVRVSTTEPGYFGDMPRPIGTILSIGNAASNGERVVTLTANAAYALRADQSVGIRVQKYLGIYPEQIDLTDEPVQHIAPISEAEGVYERNLPYIDMQLKRIFSGLYINKYFYK